MKKQSTAAQWFYSQSFNGRIEPDNPFPVGTKVICSYRMPKADQAWIHPVYVGTVEQPTISAEDWNGHNSEAEFCQRTNKLRIRYSFGIAYDNIASLARTIHKEDYMLG